jgi:hypothetical protein
MGFAFPGECGAGDQVGLLDREVCSAEPAIFEWGLSGVRHGDTVVVWSKLEVLIGRAAMAARMSRFPASYCSAVNKRPKVTPLAEGGSIA